MTDEIAFFQDREGRISVATPAMAELAGVPLERLEGESWRGLDVRSETLDIVDGIRSGVVSSGKPSEGELPGSDGAYYRYTIEPSIGEDGKVRGTFTMLRDISEHKETELLRANEMRLRTIVESTSDAVFIKDREGRHLMVNNATLRFLGRSRAEVLGKTDLEIGLDENLARKLMASDHQVMESGEGRSMEETVPTPDGPRVFLSNKVPYRDHHGRVIGVIGISQDITDRKRIEERLQAEEKWFNSLVEEAPLAIATSHNGLTTYANRRYLQMFGYDSADELIGRPYTEQIARPDRDRGLEFGVGFEGGRTEVAVMELIGLRKDGSEFPYQVALTIVDTGSGPSVLGFFTDITARRRAEDEMTMARRKFESLFNASNEGIALHELVYDGEGNAVNYRILDVNAAYERITGISKEAAVGRLASEVYQTPEPPNLDIYASVGTSGTPTVLEAFFPPDGKHFLISLFSPAPGQFATIFIDITERKVLETELEEARSRAELYVDLLTHDINNYNTAAMGYLQLAEMKITLDEKDRKLITSPLQVLAHSSELIANVSDLKKVEAGREKTQPVDIRRVLREVKEAYENPPERDVTIEIREDQGACWAMASSLVRDAFSNIVSNAIKHSTGAVHIWIHVDRLPGRGQGGEQVRVAIEDDGPGIPDERKEKVFDRSLMGLTKPVSRGLGLYLVKRLVEDHKGTVWVEDRVPGDHTKGARFVVLLPVTPPSALSACPDSCRGRPFCRRSLQNRPGTRTSTP